MRGIIAIFMKEFKIQLQYKVFWINMSLTPFFMIAPYVFTAKGVDKNMEGMVLVGTLIWYWLNQYFFSLGNAFSEEREIGTLVSIALSPVSILKFLIGKGLWIFVQCTYITSITMIVFKIIGIKEGTAIQMLGIYCLSGIYMFAFSIFFSAMVLYFKKLSSVNFMIQQGLGLVSGMTVDVKSYSKYIKVISNMIPLTFAIKLGRGILDGISKEEILIMFMILTLLSVIYFVVGALMIKKIERHLRYKGEWELW